MEPLQCPLCEIVATGRHVWAQHLNGRKHRNRALAQGVSAQVQPQGVGAPVRGHQLCATCNVYIRDDVWSTHPGSKLHQRRLRFAAAEAAHEEASRDKHGITVSEGLDFGFLEIADAEHGKQNTLTISNSVPLSNIVLSEAKLFTSVRRVSRRVLLSVYLLTALTMITTGSFRVTFAGPTQVVYGRPLLVPFVFVQTRRGIYTDRVELAFQDTRLNQKFTITRALRATVGEQAAYAALQPVAPFVLRKRTARAVERDVVAGEPPPALNAIPYKTKLPQSYIPDRMLPLLSSRTSIANTVAQLRDSFLPREFNNETYGRHYKTLLWADEYRSE